MIQAPTNDNPLSVEGGDIPASILARAKEKEVLEWLYAHAGDYETKYGLPKGILLALAGHESGHYQRAAASGTGPRGLFQLSRGMAKAYGLKLDAVTDERLDLAKTTDAAARLLSDNLRQHKGDILKALAQYNGGSEAPKWLDGRAHLYDSKNGNPGELHGFLKGVASYAREWGNMELYGLISKGYAQSENVGSDPGQAPGKTAETAVAGPVVTPPKATLSFGSAPVPDSFRQAENPGAQQPSGQGAEEEQPGAEPQTPDQQKAVPKPQPSKVRDPREIRIYEEGGKLVQTAEGAPSIPLQGAERIYSIEDTRQIIRLAQQAQTPEALIALGQFVYKATKKQDARTPEFTDS